MSSATNVFALVDVRHNGKDFKPGDKIPGLTNDDLERLEKLGAVRVEKLVETPPPPIPPPSPKDPGGEGDPPKDPPADPPEDLDPAQDPSEDPPADPPKEPNKKGKEKQ